MMTMRKEEKMKTKSTVYIGCERASCQSPQCQARCIKLFAC